MKESRLQVVSWSDVRSTFARLNPQLHKIIDAISPDDSFRLYKMSYPYGSNILRNGIFYLPNQVNHFVPITDPSIDKRTREDLFYNMRSNPICMAVKNNSEVYLELDDMVIPYIKFQPGRLLGTWGMLEVMSPQGGSFHPGGIWNMSAGMRSLFMLPKIGDKTFHKRLQQEFNITTPTPKNLTQQWYVFKDIVAQQQTDESWEFELICFSKKWFENKNDPQWLPFYNHLLEQTLHNSDYIRNKSFWDLVFSIIRKEQGIPPSSYINDMVKQLYAISCGFGLGFAPSVDEFDGPVKLLQEAYVHGNYKLNYLPVMMSPHQFDGTRPVYFSLNHTTALEFSKKATRRESMIEDTVKLAHALESFQKGFHACNFDFSETKFYKLLAKTQFDSFYDGVTDYSAIHPISELFRMDDGFHQVLIDHDDLALPQRGNFIRSCVRINKS